MRDVEHKMVLLDELINMCDELRDEANLEIINYFYNENDQMPPLIAVSDESSKWNDFLYKADKYFTTFEKNISKSHKTEFDNLRVAQISTFGRVITLTHIEKLKSLFNKMKSDLQYELETEQSTNELVEDDNKYLGQSNIQVGNGNSFNNVMFNQYSGDMTEVRSDENERDKKNFITRHPWISAIIIAVISGFILSFSVWQSLVEHIEVFFSKVI